MSSTSYRRDLVGKHRGIVTDNRDPLMQGRIRARVPTVLGHQETGWALPCVPYGGNRVGFFFIPPIDANVWIEFENGDPDYPIWVGCFWGEDQAPARPAVPDFKLIKTDSVTITINDSQGSNGITIETTNGLKIIMDTTGIELSNSSSKIKMTSASVSINDGALEIT
jgi:uncharacterized protein involved in type VI secretion and phage assembly